jgi:putative ABC transport system ATP-binding protein
VLEGVVRQYGRGPGGCIALNGISLAIASDQFVALAGPSGSGKSTLLNIMAGLDRPDIGRVRFQDRDIANLSDAELSDVRLSHIGFVFQDARLAPVLSVAENIELPMLFRRDLSSSERERRIAAALQDVGLWHKRHRRPSELSGGERQRAALARALAGRPTVILADEPTANLDRQSGAAIIRLMRSLGTRQGTTIICATHDAALLTSATTVFHIRDGQLETSCP